MRALILCSVVLSCAGALAQSPAQVTPSATLGDAACFPTDSLKPGAEAPCVKIPLLSYECVYGTPLASLATASGDAAKPSATSGPKDVQKCYCDKGGKGEFIWQYMDGCANCMKLHGAAQAERHDFTQLYFQSQSSKYCAMPTPPVFEDFVQSVWAAVPSPSSKPSNVLGSATDTSLYFTLSPDYTLPTASATTTTATSRSSRSSILATGLVTGTGGTTSRSSANSTIASPTISSSASSPAVPSQSSNAAVAVHVSGLGMMAVFGAAMLL